MVMVQALQPLVCQCILTHRVTMILTDRTWAEMPTFVPCLLLPCARMPAWVSVICLITTRILRPTRSIGHMSECEDKASVDEGVSVGVGVDASVGVGGLGVSLDVSVVAEFPHSPWEPS